MRGLLLILVLAVAYICADQSTMTPEAMACRVLLKPIRSEEAKKAALNTCIAAQTSLQATIDELMAAEVANASLPSEVNKPPSDCKEGSKGNPVMVLMAAGKPADVTTLNKCLAKENGYLVMAANGTSSFDVVKLKAEIKAKVAGTSSQAKTQLGLDKCPEADLATFDDYKYMKCVKAYCATGAAEPNKS